MTTAPILLSSVSTYFIPTLIVPHMLVTHLIVFRLLVRRERGTDDRRAPEKA